MTTSLFIIIYPSKSKAFAEFILLTMRCDDKVANTKQFTMYRCSRIPKIDPHASVF